MSVLDPFTSDFHQSVKQRGGDYFRQKRVRITSSTPSLIEAEVRGHDLYDVTIRWADGAEYECTCPYYIDHGDPCKHCWATILQAHAQHVLPMRNMDDSSAASSKKSESRAMDENEEAEDEEHQDQEDDDLAARPPSNTYGPSRRRHTLGSTRAHGESTSHQPATAAWKRKIQALTQQMRPAPLHTAAQAVWPAGRRLLYLIDPSTLNNGAFTLELAQQSLKKDGKYDRPKQLRLRRDQLGELPDPHDRQILQLLLGTPRAEFSYYGYGNSEAPRKFELTRDTSELLLEPICETGRCRLVRFPQDPDPLPLSWDSGPPWELWLEVKASPGGRYLVLEGSLRRSWPEPAKVGAAEDHAINGNALALQGDALAPGQVSENAVSRAPGDAAEGAAEPASGQVLDEAASPGQIALHEQRMPMADALVLTRDGLLVAGGKIARYEHFDAYELMMSVREGMKLSVPIEQGEELVKTLFALPRLPRLELPESLQFAETRATPRPRLTIKRPPKVATDERLVGTISFDYGGKIISRHEPHNAVFDPQDKLVVYRDPHHEAQHLGRLLQLGFREAWDYRVTSERAELRLSPSKLPKVVATLTREGWHIEADGKLYRQPGEFNIQVKSGIDWFELHGEVSFGEMAAPLPRLLAAVRKGENAVLLDDGTYGLLPQEWLKKYGALAGVGEENTDHLRFSTRQVGFLDALLTSMPEARFDEAFTRMRDELARFKGIAPLDAPAGFQGELRGYQREGLGWMAFLRKFGFGGCLADDMGLGKTVQVLALLEDRRQQRAAGDSKARAKSSAGPGNKPAAAPSLVVAPRSLIFNWMQEARRFCPELRVLDHTSVLRERNADHFADYDLILTTYGTLRRDMAFIKDFKFDYAILDEAQAIKNASSESAKAVRLLQATHRLALSGTPVQNHLGELWSLFEFLDPGMMGSAGVFRDLTASGAGADPAAREVLAKALRPFILRRTKEQVAKDLPEKMEQTVFCVLEAEQRKLYNELRDHYRTSLLDRIAREGINKAKIQVLEALLRLRQAACHPGLIDKTKSKHGSAKLDALMGHVTDVLEEGHKVLVFSQFTSFLAIVRKRLDEAKITYEYLDGKTRDRQARVERFQDDPACKLFLISLKAGGLGLNLTAAEYVFLLDPWWNPAVEAQAIDRAHRIGQTQRVFAYRLIAKDTVEEKVLQLQQSKKDLADAIINADNSLIRTLKRDDLELLLS